jgi:hypothetical protein
MLESFVFKILYFYFLALVLAIVEIQIEGKSGWAESLPTWKPKKGSKADRWHKFLRGGKPLTGYHVAINLLVLAFFHLPFVWNGDWSIFAELEILGIFFIFISVWDYLWFILNPKRSLRDFKAKKVWWHKHWWLKVPVDYWLSIIIAFIFFLPLIIINPVVGWSEYISLLVFNIIFLVFTILVYPKAY